MSPVFYLLALTFLAPLLALPAGFVPGEASYLTAESLDLPLDQKTERMTARPLAPGKTYRVTIFSDSFNLAHLNNGSLLFTQGAGWSFAPSITSGSTRDARDKVLTLEYLVEGRGDRLKVRSREHWYSPLTVVLRLTVSEVRTSPPTPQPHSVAFASPAPLSSSNPLLPPDLTLPDRQAMSIEDFTALVVKVFLVAVLGCLALAVLIWRVVVHIRRRQLHITLRRLMADIARVEKARTALHHHLDKEF